jgi:cyclic-di-GMP-binding biofilm dispersal mediator protein
VLARRLHDAGASLTLAGRDAGRLAALGLPGATVVADLRQPGAAAEVVEAAVAAHGRLDGVVLAHGVVAFGPVAELADETLVALLETNTLAPIRVVRAAVPHLAAAAAERGGAFVVSLTGLVAETPTAGMAAYSASKAAMAAFDAAAGRELRRQRITVLDARPGHTETGLATRPIAGEPPRLPTGFTPDAVAERVLAALVAGERDLPGAAFTG